MTKKTHKGKDMGDSNAVADAFSAGVRPTLDLVDDLRKLGLQKDVPIPQIAVMGDQSSGKSIEKMVSALEHYMHGQEPEQLKCLFEPNKLAKKKRDNLVATVGRLQKAQARMNQGIVARG